MSNGTTPVIVPVETPTLGDRSYLVHDGSVAIVVDPQRDIDRVLDLAEEAGVTITHVFETHIHNDYVTGGLALAEATGAAYHVNAEDDVSFDRTPVSDGDVVEVSADLKVRVIATPGHTYTHLSYALDERSGRDGRRLHRRLAAVRRDRPPGPARPRAHRRPRPPPVRLRAPAGRHRSPTTPTSAHPRVRLLLLVGLLRQRHVVDDRQGAAARTPS